jgi:hypothetical protein
MFRLIRFLQSQDGHQAKRTPIAINRKQFARAAEQQPTPQVSNYNSTVLLLVVALVFLAEMQIGMTPLVLPMVVCLAGLALVQGFCPRPTSFGIAMRSSRGVLYSTPQDEDQPDGGEGAELASQLFQMAQKYGIGVGQEDLADDDDDDDEQEATDEDDEDDDDEEEYNYPQGAINAFLGYDTGNVGEKLAGNVTLTDTQLYSEVKERVLDTAGGFVEMVRSANEDDDDNEDEEYWEDKDKPKVYVPPVRVPDSELTAGEVVLLVLQALNNNDNPSPNRGVEILFGYSSPASTIQEERKIGLTEQDYADFLKDSEYKVLFQHEKVVRITMLLFSMPGSSSKGNAVPMNLAQLACFFVPLVSHRASTRGIILLMAQKRSSPQDCKSGRILSTWCPSTLFCRLRLGVMRNLAGWSIVS